MIFQLKNSCYCVVMKQYSDPPYSFPFPVSESQQKEAKMGEEELGPAAAYSAQVTLIQICALQILSQNTQVAAWLNQAYHAQMIQIGFPSFLAYQASLGRLGPQVLLLSASLELIINFSYQV